MDPFLAQIILFAGNFAPRGWAFCDGQLLTVKGHEALFALLGTIYGGDGRTTFALPDLRGRVPMHPGNGPGLTPRKLGEKGGRESVSDATTVAEAAGSEVVKRGASNLQPFQCLNYIIALQGVFPSRS